MIFSGGVVKKAQLILLVQICNVNDYDLKDMKDNIAQTSIIYDKIKIRVWFN